jgi:hypothetical protein
LLCKVLLVIILQKRISIRNLVEDISLFSSKQLKHSVKESLIEVSKRYLLEVKIIYDSLVMRVLLLLSFTYLNVVIMLLT